MLRVFQFFTVVSLILGQISVGKLAWADPRSPLQGASLMVQPRERLSNAQVFAVTLRGIQGEGFLSNGDTRTGDLTLENDLEFLRPKLSKLPFSTYRLVTKSSEMVRGNRTRTFNLVEGQMVKLQPMDVTENSVTMWMRWTGADGMEILDTQIHFAADETMLAGIEASDDKGMILAITVSPEVVQSVE